MLVFVNIFRFQFFYDLKIDPATYNVCVLNFHFQGEI